MAASKPYKWIYLNHGSFSSMMVNRFSAPEDYRYSLNGQEHVDEIKGIGTHTTAEYWEYDTRLGRRWNLDPVDQVSVSNYASLLNNPIFYTDPLGNVAGDYYTKGGKWLGSDGVNDNKAYVVNGDTKEFKIDDFKKGGQFYGNPLGYNLAHTNMVKDPSPLNPTGFTMQVGQTSSVEKLSLTNSQLLERAQWVYGEICSSIGFKITEVTNSNGLAESIQPTNIEDFMAHAMANMRRQKRPNGEFSYKNEIDIYKAQTKTVNGVVTGNHNDYWNGTGTAGNDNSRNFSKWYRDGGLTELVKHPYIQGAFSAVIRSIIGASTDPTRGGNGWNADESDKRRTVTIRTKNNYPIVYVQYGKY